MTSTATAINTMNEKEILDVVYRQIVFGYEQELTDKAVQHFKELKEFIEEERDKKEQKGGWL
jgi:hypothetical protein